MSNLVTNIPYSHKIDTVKLNKVIEVSNYLGINPAWLMNTINFETAGTFSPSKKNQIGSVGLIQFTRDKAGVNYKTINGKRYLLDDIAKMDFIRQMDLVKEYYKPYRNKLNNFLDVYLVTFFPMAIDKTDDFILKTSMLSANLIAKMNPIFDLDKNGQITLKEIKTFFKIYTKSNWSLINTNSKPKTIFDKLGNLVEYIIIPVILFFLSFYTLTL